MDSWQQIDCMMPFSWVCKGHPENIVSTSTTAPTRNNESAVRFMIVFHKPRLYSIKGLVYASIYIYMCMQYFYLRPCRESVWIHEYIYICVVFDAVNELIPPICVLHAHFELPHRIYDQTEYMPQTTSICINAQIPIKSEPSPSVSVVCLRRFACT